RHSSPRPLDGGSFAQHDGRLFCCRRHFNGRESGKPKGFLGTTRCAHSQRYASPFGGRRLASSNRLYAGENPRSGSGTIQDGGGEDYPRHGRAPAVVFEGAAILSAGAPLVGVAGVSGVHFGQSIAFGSGKVARDAKWISTFFWTCPLGPLQPGGSD